MADAIRIWSTTQLSTPISSYDGTDETITVGIDPTGTMGIGSLVKIINATGDFAGNNGVHTVSDTIAVSGGPVAVIPVASNLSGGSSGSKGSLVWRECVTFDGFSGFDPQFNDPSSAMMGRYNLPVTVRPADTLAAQRYVTALRFNVFTNDFDIRTPSGKRFAQFLREQCVDTDSELLFFTCYEGTDAEGSDYTEKFCYTGRLQGDPGWLYGTKLARNGSWPEMVLTFACEGSNASPAPRGDGTYTDFNDPSSVTFRRRPA